MKDLENDIRAAESPTPSPLPNLQERLESEMRERLIWSNTSKILQRDVNRLTLERDELRVAHSALVEALEGMLEVQRLTLDHAPVQSILDRINQARAALALAEPKL